MPKQVQSKATAKIDRLSGRAAIVETDGTLYILDLKESPHLVNGEGVHLGIFLQPAMTHLEDRDAGEYPYKELIKYVQLALNQEDCLMMLLISVDPESEQDNRKMAAGEAVRLLKKREVRNWIIQRLTETPLPNVADVEGVPNEELKRFIQEIP